MAGVLTALIVAAPAATAAPGGYSQTDIDRSIQRGVDWLSTQQHKTDPSDPSADGSWDSGAGFPEAETGLAIVSYGVLANGDLTFATVPGASAADRARWRHDLERAVDYLLSKQNANGSWDGFLGTYSTGIALLALSYVGDLQSGTRDVAGAIAKGRRFLIMTQQAPPSVTGNTGSDAGIPGPTPDCSSANTSPTANYCGGWDYLLGCCGNRSDQSNTGFALTGLAATGGVPEATANVNIGWQRNVQMLKTNQFTTTGTPRGGKPANDGGGSYEPAITTGDFSSNANDTGSLIFGFAYDKVPATDVGAQAAIRFGGDVIDEYELEKGVAGAPRTMVFHTGAERDGTCKIGDADCTWEFAPGEGGYHYSLFALSKGLGQYLPGDPTDPANFYAKVVDLLLSQQLPNADADPGAWPNDPRDDGSQIGATAFAIMSLGRVGQPANVSGTVYDDADGSATRGAGEAGLGGWTVYADLDDDGALDTGEPSAVTAADGTYTIHNLPETTGSIREVGQAGFECTSPPGCAYRGVEFNLGANITGQDFGNRRPPVATPAATPSGGVAGATASRCGSLRRFTIRVRIRRSLRPKVVSVRVTVAGRHVRAHRRGRRWVAVVNLRTRPKGTYHVKLRLGLRGGGVVSGKRTYHTCVKRRPGHGPPPV
jgi:hypothetical protein